MSPKLRIASLVLLGFAGAMPTSPATAQPSSQEAPIVITRRIFPSPDLLVRTVSIADLDLKSAAGQQEMEKRVGKAVEDMCAIVGPLPSYKGPMEQPCRDEAWASARPQMTYAVQRAHGS
jgi:UrcA family protein